MQRPSTIYFEDLEMGDEIGPLERWVTGEMVEAFCDLWGTAQPNRFVDAEKAKQVGLSAPILPGIMSVALMSQLFTSWVSPGALKKIDVIFRQPVPHAPMKVMALVTDKRDDGGEKLVECDIYLIGQDEERLVGGKVVVALPSRVS